MKTKIFVLAIITLLTACNSGNVKKVADESAAPSASSPVGDVKVAAVIPFSKSNNIASNIKDECNLGEQLSRFIGESSDKHGMKVSRVGVLNSGKAKNVLMVEISDAVSMGNAFMGHRKSISIGGTLYKDGKMVKTFKGRRITGGGAFGGYKGSCAVLGRSAKALGKDVALWLKNPAREKIGDL